MATAVTVEDLFASQSDLHWPTGQHRELRDYDLVRERVALPAEPAAVRRGDHADPRRRQLEDFGESAVHVVGRLGGAPQRQLAVRMGRPVRHRRMLLHRQVGAPLEKEQVLAHQVRLCESRLDVTELEIDQLVDVARIGVIVDRRGRVFDCVQSIRDRAQRLVLHTD